MQFYFKIGSLQNDITANKNHIIITVDVDVETIDNLLPEGKKLDSTQDIEDFQDHLDDNTKRKLVSNLRISSLI